MRRTCVLLTLGGLAMAQADELPDFTKLWNFTKPAETRARFLELVPVAEAAGDDDYRLQLQTQIARTWGLEGKFEEAHAVLDAVEKEHAWDGASMPVVRVRYLLERGRAFNSGKKKDKAKPLFLEAWDTARKAKLDALAVDAAHMMAIVEPAAADQHAWNRKAMELAEASDDPRARGWLGSLYNNVGYTHLQAGEYGKALDLFEKQRAFYAERGSPESQRIAKWMVAHTYRKMGRLDEALAMQREMEQALRDAGSGDDGFVCEEIGEILLAQGKTDEARPYFARAHAKLKEIAWVRDDPARLERLRKLAAGDE